MNQEYETRYLKARRAVIAQAFRDLNDSQQQAVLTTEGPLLLLAGAGSGKTTVLVHRIANLMRYGSASDSNEIPDYITEQDVETLEAFLQSGQPATPDIDALCTLHPVNPWNIIAITFTNKAANELKNRLERMLGTAALDVWAMTFHSACCRILRREIDRLGYDARFTIYDTADSERVMKDVCRDLHIDEKTLAPRFILNRISKEKDLQRGPKEVAESAAGSGDYRAELIAKAYAEYQRRLREANALDFDDIILRTVELLQQFDEVREFYQRKFRYILIDEYQDTNNLQYQLAALLAGRWENICVVGDDDQSIYKFRGATIDNILNFEHQFQGAKVIRLEQNYRSTQAILDAANAVIRNNRARKGKKLWTQNPAGERITVYEAMNESAEANFVADRIFSLRKTAEYKDFAVLYRTNAQSNAIERSFKANGIPYRIIGGTRFYDRLEIKDMTAYLCLINNRADDLRLLRIINNPARGIGTKTLEMVQRLASARGVPLYEIISHAGDYPALEKSAGKLLGFSAIIEDCAALLQTSRLPDFYDTLLIKSGYAAMLSQKGDIDSRTRLENIQELRSSLVGYEENHPEDASLAGFLEEVALYTDIEQYDKDADAVVMMTMHAAKGLEFPHVFLVGMEEGLFPSLRCIGEPDEMEEERRLCYVAITRAKQTLCLSFADQRMLYGHTNTNRVSRFVEEIPPELLDRQGMAMPSYMNYGGYGTSPRPGRTENSSRQSWSEAPRQSAPRRTQPPIQSAKAAAPLPKLQPGMMVEHKSFGQGMVISVLPMGNDALLEIAFDRVGTKRLMARTAMAHMSVL